MEIGYRLNFSLFGKAGETSWRKCFTVLFLEDLEVSFDDGCSLAFLLAGTMLSAASLWFTGTR